MVSGSAEVSVFINFHVFARIKNLVSVYIRINGHFGRIIKGIKSDIICRHHKYISVRNTCLHVCPRNKLFAIGRSGFRKCKLCSVCSVFIGYGAIAISFKRKLMNLCNCYCIDVYFLTCRYCKG